MIQIIFGLILGLVHYFSDRIHVAHGIHKMKTMSFTAGIFITYMFLHLFPNLYQGGLFFNRLSLIFVLIGFALFHVMEKYIYQHASGKELKKELRISHSFAFFFYHFMIGIILVNITKLNVISGLLLFIPILSYNAISSISMKEIHEIVTGRRTAKFLLSISTLLGVILATYILIPEIIYYSLFGFVIGTLLYIIILEAVPKEREGKPAYFIFGILLYSIIIAFTWVV